MIAHACFACLLSVQPAPQGSRAWLAEIALEGPIREVVFDLGASGQTEITGALLAGETRTLVVPLPAQSAGERFTPTIHAASFGDATETARGAARFVRWIEPISSGLDTLPPGLRARPRPPVARTLVRASPAALLALAALAVSTMGLAKRARTALAVAAIGAGVVFWLEPVRAGDLEAHVTVIEADASSRAWLEVEAAADRLAVRPPLDAIAIESRPPAASLEWRIPVQADGPMEVLGRGVSLYRLDVFEPGDGRIERAGNRFAPLAQAWVREDGEWRAHGAWPTGEPLPDATGPVAEPLPGWLASGLPQGPSILVARLAERPGVYLRLSNFE